MLYDKLYDWQQNIAANVMDKSAYGLFLDCGLGKTPISLSLAELNLCNKVMVITINSKAVEDVNVEGSWMEWVSQSDIPYTLYNKKATTFDSEDSFFIVNYESLFQRSEKGVLLKDNILAFIKSCRKQQVALIVDESHKMKNLQSKQTKAINKIKLMLERTAKKLNVYLLTGTPFTQGFIDLYTQLKLLGLQETKGWFEEQFCERGHLKNRAEWQQPIVGYKNVDQLYNLVHQYAITIKKEEVIKLPPAVYVYKTLPMSEEFKMFTMKKVKKETLMAYLKKRGIDYSDINALEYEIFYQQLFDKNKKVVDNPFYKNIDFPNEKYFCPQIGVFWLRARELSIGFQGNGESSIWFDKSRVEAVKQLLEEHEDNYVLFYNFEPEIQELYPICRELGYNVDVWNADKKSDYFYQKYSKQTEGEQLMNKKNIILAQSVSGSTGKNWQKYNKVIIFSTPAFKDWIQGKDRVRRIGQTETQIYYVFAQNNWLDDGMKATLDENTEYTEDMFMDGLRKAQEIC